MRPTTVATQSLLDTRDLLPLEFQSELPLSIAAHPTLPTQHVTQGPAQRVQPLSERDTHHRPIIKRGTSRPPHAAEPLKGRLTRAAGARRRVGPGGGRRGAGEGQ